MGKTEEKKTVIRDEILDHAPEDFKPEDEMLDIHIEARRISETETKSSVKVHMHCHENFVEDIFVEMLKGDPVLCEVIARALVSVKLETMLENKLTIKGQA